MNSFTTLLAIFAALFSFVACSPIAARDVYVPPIIKPDAHTVWHSGHHYKVTWNTTNPPAQITNTKGMVVLRKGDRTVPGAGGLNDPLASNFSILLGTIEIKVPQVKNGTDYSIVLFGDSGNFSPQFTIIGHP